MKAALRERYPVVHIASHFQFMPGDETRSYLLLGDGDDLTLSEVKNSLNLFSGVDLLTLSACNTASGGAGADGREVKGLASSLNARAPSQSSRRCGPSPTRALVTSCIDSTS